MINYFSIPSICYKEHQREAQVPRNESSEVSGIIKPGRKVKLNRSQAVIVHKFLTTRYLPLVLLCRPTVKREYICEIEMFKTLWRVNYCKVLTKLFWNHAVQECNKWIIALLWFYSEVTLTKTVLIALKSSVKLESNFEVIMFTGVTNAL